MSVKRRIELAEAMAKYRRQISRIKRLQSLLNIKVQTLQVMHEVASRELWHLESGYKLHRKLTEFSESDAERATALLLSFDPLRNSKK